MFYEHSRGYFVTNPQHSSGNISKIANLLKMFMFGDKPKADGETENENTTKMIRQAAIFLACFAVARGICNFNWSTYQ